MCRHVSQLTLTYIAASTVTLQEKLTGLSDLIVTPLPKRLFTLMVHLYLLLPSP